MKEVLKELNKNIVLNNQINYQILMSNIIVNSNIDKVDKEILLLLLQNRDSNYVRINHNAQCFENIQKYLKLIQPLAIPLDSLKRIGGNSDGGYVIMECAGGGAF
ncbi:hypothetical protein [Helicobacter sp.]|uniref:hypothetical protein n=1 Tax=Helicobacter sp. TaxID=218 RepID=UPI0025C4E859|nr:hypothetical protein [Helicobacter sp.]MCI5968562.1 hypothetical protein [Helicobacter sp.]MDY2584772.1 hypothetical protein [Helicobacter sp.]